MSEQTDRLVADWMERCAHQSKVFINSADVAEWQAALSNISPHLLDAAFRDYFESGNYPAIREIKMHVSRSLNPPPPEPVKYVRRSAPGDAPMATGNARFDHMAVEFIEQIRHPNDWENLPIDATDDQVRRQCQRYADAAEEYWRRRTIVFHAADIYQEVEGCWLNAVHARRARHQEREAERRAAQERKDALVRMTTALAKRGTKPPPVAVVAAAPVLPDGRVVKESFDPENPDSIPF